MSKEFKDRLQKLKELKKLDINPYIERFEGTHSLKEALTLGQKVRSTEEIKKDIQEQVKVRGRLMSFRAHGKMSFAHLQDFSGRMQICFMQDILGKEKYKLLKKIDIGDFLGLTGEIFKTKHDEITILVKDFILLSKTLRPLPEKWHGLKDKEAKYRMRYLDLVMDENTKERFLFRIEFIQKIREFLNKHDFLEVETPILAPQASGAVAKPFSTHHNALDADFFLRIAPETYLKRCVAGGFEKVYEFARCFRNEGIDPSHLQEFTILEYYVAYWNYEDNMNFTEELFAHILQEMMGGLKIKCLDREGNEQEIDFTPPWKRIKFHDLIQSDCGIDINEYKTAAELRKRIKKDKIEIEDMKKLGLGNLYDTLYKKVSRQKIIKPIFITSHPALTKPLARRNDKNPQEADNFQLVVNTWELINAYSEIVDPVDQRERLEEQAKAKKKGDEEAMDMDEDFVLALEHGLPPTSGWGLGLDRLIALLTKQENLKDVVLFPLLKSLEETQCRGQACLTSTESSNPTNMPITDPGITHDEAEKLLREHMKNETFYLHCRESEVIMRALARHLNEDEEAWGIAGLLHDLDWEMEGVQENPEKHGVLSVEILQKAGINPEIIHAIQAHNSYTGVKRESKLDHALAAAETITGLIFATALVYPDKKLKSVKPSSIVKRMKKKDFARNCSRERILECEKIGLSIEEFAEIALKAMQGISDELGL